MELTRACQFAPLKITLGSTVEPKALITADIANGNVTRASGSRSIDDVYGLTRFCFDAPLFP